jgi:hypothetical protein
MTSDYINTNNHLLTSLFNIQPTFNCPRYNRSIQPTSQPWNHYINNTNTSPIHTLCSVT